MQEKNNTEQVGDQHTDEEVQQDIEEQKVKNHNLDINIFLENIS